jgi:hypothetical protein
VVIGEEFIGVGLIEVGFIPKPILVTFDSGFRCVQGGHSVVVRLPRRVAHRKRPNPWPLGRAGWVVAQANYSRRLPHVVPGNQSVRGIGLRPAERRSRNQPERERPKQASGHKRRDERDPDLGKMRDHRLSRPPAAQSSSSRRVSTHQPTTSPTTKTAAKYGQ